MADPVSLTASVLTLTDAAVAVGKFVKNVRDCPEQLLVVRDEVKDLRCVISEVEKLHAEQKPGDFSKLTHLLERAQSTTAELVQFLDRLSRNRRGDICIVDRVKWSAGRRKQAELLIHKLREIRCHLDTLIIVSIARRLQHTSVGTGNSQPVPCRGRVAATEISTSNLGQGDILNNEGVIPPPKRFDYIKTVPADISRKDIPAKDFAIPSVSVQGVCSARCRCRCHVPISTNTPASLRRFFGHLTLTSFCGLPFIKFSCDTAECSAVLAGQVTLRVSYHFPAWLLSKAVDAAVHKSAFGDISARITVRCVRPRESSPFYAAARGEIEVLQYHFSRGLARPDDVDEQGTTLLLTAVAFGKAKAVNFLLSIGADPHYPNQDAISAFDRAWDGIIVRSAQKDPSHDALRDVFNNTEELECWQLSHVHKIVLNLHPGDLCEELKKSAAEVNALDSHRRAPLWWAAATGSFENVKTLLDHGADPDVADCEGIPPLRKAIAANRLDIYKLLLDYKANPNWRTLIGMQVSHFVAHYSQLDVHYLELSLNPDLDLNARGGYGGTTPLIFAVRSADIGKVQWLLDHGADIDRPDTDGTSTPLILAIVYGLFDIVVLLLARGAKVPKRDSRNKSVLDQIFYYASPQLMDRLAAVGSASQLGPINLANGLSAMRDLELIRSNFEHVTSFIRLLSAASCEQCVVDAQEGIPAMVSLDLVIDSASEPTLAFPSVQSKCEGHLQEEEFFEASETPARVHSHDGFTNDLLVHLLSDKRKIRTSKCLWMHSIPTICYCQIFTLPFCDSMRVSFPTPLTFTGLPYQHYWTEQCRLPPADVIPREFHTLPPWTWPV